MKFMTFLLIVAAAAAQSGDPKQATGSGVQWIQEPDSFRGLKFGMSESAAKSIFKGMGRCIVYLQRGQRACVARYDIGNASTFGFLMFADDKFVQALANFNSRHSIR